MKLYADRNPRRVLQVAADVAALIWVVVTIRVARLVDEHVDAVAEDVRRSDGAGRSLAGNLADAGDLLGRAPLVGDEVRGPFDAAAGASRDLAATGVRAADTIDSLGTWLAVLLVVAGLLLLLPTYVPRRVGFVVAATAAQRLSRSRDTDLLALRALSRQPPTRVARRVPGAADGWRRGDPAVIEALADLELASLGLAPGRR